MFFGALPPHIGSLCVLPRPFAGGLFLRDFVPHRQTSSSASNIPSWIKLRSWQSHHHSLPRRRKSVSLFESTIPAKESTFPAIEPQRILPTAFHHRVIARHSSPQLRVSAVSVCLRSQGPFGLFMVRAGLRPRGILIVWAQPLSGL